MIFLVVVGIYELSSNSVGLHCSVDPDCFKNYVTNLSMYNKSNESDSMNLQQWLNFLLMFIMIIMLQILRRHKRIIAARCDERDISSSDYTLMVENIPNTPQIHEAIKKLFEQLEPLKNRDGEKIDFKVMRVNLTYNLTELVQ